MGQTLESNYNEKEYVKWLQEEHKFLLAELQYYKALCKDKQQLLEQTLKQLYKQRNKHVK